MQRTGSSVSRYAPDPLAAPASNAQADQVPETRRRDAQMGKMAMGTIEASVTKLLIATKQLLESLTQWSRRQASENDVSDIYVSLGNEFNRAVVCFQNAGIDMSDLIQTPELLRDILERALGEDATPINLERFLPRIREIIINLLQGLKRKQQIHRIQNGEAAAGPPRSRRNDSGGSASSAGTQPMTRFASQERPSDYRVRSTAASMASAGRSQSDRGQQTSPERRPSQQRITQQPSQRRLPNLPGEFGPSFVDPRGAPDPPGRARTQSGIHNAGPDSSGNSDPVTQLNQLGQLERRSSKRFSDNYLAQLTSSPGNTVGSRVTVDGVRNKMSRAMPDLAEDEESAGRRRSSTLTIPATSRQPCLYLRHRERTRKVPMPDSPSLEGLQTLVKETFEIDDVTTLYVANTDRIAYELEDLADVQDQTILEVRLPSPEQGTKARDTAPRGAFDENLKDWLAGQLQSLSKQIVTELKQEVVTPPAAKAVGGKPDTRAPTQAAKGPDPQIAQLQEQIATLTQVNAKLERQNGALEQQLVTRLESPEAAAAQVSTVREEVIALTAKHEQRCTELTARTEELMNDIDTVRVDLAKRKVSPRPQQLQELTTVLEGCLKEAANLRVCLRELDSKSNKLWETELMTITREQEALEYHKAYMTDMDADLAGYQEVLQTVHKVEEQKKLSPAARKQPVVLDTTGDPSTAIKFVQADIKSLQVNHEERAAAIEAAERQREKERVYLLENPHTKEVAEFVASKQLKSTGGAEEVERRRQLKDEAHRKRFFTPPGTPVKEEDDSMAEIQVDDAKEAVKEPATVKTEKTESQSAEQADAPKQDKPAAAVPVLEIKVDPATPPEPLSPATLTAKTADSSAVLNRISKRSSRVFSTGGSVGNAATNNRESTHEEEAEETEE